MWGIYKENQKMDFKKAQERAERGMLVLGAHDAIVLMVEGLRERKDVHDDHKYISRSISYSKGKNMTECVTPADVETACRRNHRRHKHHEKHEEE